MRSKKTYIILIIILLIFAITMYFLVAKNNIKEEKTITTLIVGDTSIWNYTNKEWVNVENPITIDKLNWLDFNVFENNKYKGKYKVWNDTEKWYYFDKNNNPITTDGNIFSYKSNYEIKVKDFMEKQLEAKDKEYINHVLEENNLSISSKFTSNYKVELDYDSDSIIETFYIITNAFPTEFVPDQIFSIVFMAKENNIYYLYKEIDDNRVNNGCKPYINTILDLNDDGVDELILSCGRYSENGIVDMLYKFEDNEFKIKISNQ